MLLLVHQMDCLKVLIACILGSYRLRKSLVLELIEVQ